jgi:glycosyltransferase involved in cell wall biosynthesis
MPTKPIKLFVDAHSFDAGFQGTQTFIRELYSSLLNNYPSLDIYWGVQHPDKITALLPTVKPQNILLYKNRKPGILRFVFDIPAFIKIHQFNYAHFQYLAPLPQQGCKYIVTTHDVLFNDFPAYFSFLYRLSRNFLFGMGIKNAAIKTTVSNYSRQRIAHHYHIPQNQITVIPNGVSEPVISTQAAREYIKKCFGIQNFILYVSRIEPRKNHAMLLDAYLKLRLYDQDIPLVFIGQQSIPVEALNYTIQNLTAAQKQMFHWFPQVSGGDLSAFYSASRLFVYPSKAEGFGIPPLEAAVYQVPVLCSSATAMGDFDFFEPYTFDPENHFDFEQKLAFIITTPPSAKQLKALASAVLAKYRWQHSAELLYKLLSEDANNQVSIKQASHPDNNIHLPHLQYHIVKT